MLQTCFGPFPNPEKNLDFSFWTNEKLGLIKSSHDLTM